MLLTTVFFVNHTVRKNNFDATEGKKCYPSVQGLVVHRLGLVAQLTGLVAH
jgi:hypothetical protein